MNELEMITTLSAQKLEKARVTWLPDGERISTICSAVLTQYQSATDVLSWLSARRTSRC